MFPKEYHIFVIVSTFIYFIILKNFKSDIESNIKKRHLKSYYHKKKSSNLIYVLFLPALLYAGGYILIYNYKNGITMKKGGDLTSTEGILTAPYPDSVSM
jgi:hypothetical protein